MYDNIHFGLKCFHHLLHCSIETNKSTSALTTFHITPLLHLHKNYSCLASMKHSRRILQVKIAGQQVRIMQNDPAMVKLYGPWCVVKTHPDVAPFGLNKP